MNRKFFLIGIVVFLALGVFVVWKYYATEYRTTEITTQCDHTMMISGEKFCVEVAATDESRQKGLSGHTPLGKREAMTFIFPSAQKHAFWMKEMLFPLDFIWVRSHVVVDLMEHIPAPKEGTPEKDLPVYMPKEPVDMVIEVPAGTIEDLRIRIGDTIRAQ